MKKNYFGVWAILGLIVLSSYSVSLRAQNSTTQNEEEVKNVKIKYKESGRIDFESLLIEGERKKPELSIVTGNVGESDSGLMIMRENFADTMMNEFGEVVE